MKGHITEKELECFSYEFRRSFNLGKLYLLFKIHKSIENVPSRPMTNCGTAIEVLEFLDHRLESVMQSGKSYIKDCENVLGKIKPLRCISDNAILVAADAVVLYPSIPHQAGFVLNPNKAGLF